MTNQWILIMASESGDPVTYLTTDQLEDLMTDPTGWGVYKFLDAVPSETDPNYWPTDVALLMRAEIVTPRQVATAWELP